MASASGGEPDYLEGLAASSRLLYGFVDDAGKPGALLSDRATLRGLAELADMLNDLAALVVAQPERDPFRNADQQIVVAAYHWATATSQGEEFALAQALRAAVAAHNRLAHTLAAERS